jgi:hypothetical protein
VQTEWPHAVASHRIAGMMSEGGQTEWPHASLEPAAKAAMDIRLFWKDRGDKLAAGFRQSHLISSLTNFRHTVQPPPPKWKTNAYSGRL